MLKKSLCAICVGLVCVLLSISCVSAVEIGYDEQVKWPEQTFSPAVAAAKYAVVTRRYVEQINAQNEPFLKVLGELPLYQNDPQTCIAAAIALVNNEDTYSFSLVDFDRNGVPELVQSVRLTENGYGFRVYSIVYGEMQWLAGGYPEKITGFALAWSDQGDKIIGAFTENTSLGCEGDRWLLLDFDEQQGWDKWEALYRQQLWTSSREKAKNIGVWHNGVEHRFAGYWSQVRQFVEYYPQKEMVCAEVQTDVLFSPNDENGLISDPALAWEMAGRLLEAWDNLAPAAPVTGYTVLDVLEGNIPEE